MRSEQTGADAAARLFAALQIATPTHALSNLVFRFTRVRRPWIAHHCIGAFMRAFNVSLNDAQQNHIDAFDCFNDFFTRALKPGVRPLPDDPTSLVSPVDGRVSQLGPIDNGSLVQAKGHHYTVAALLGGVQLASDFRHGQFCTIYLAPANYHRVHAPCAMTLRTTRLIPGRLFSVNPATTRTVDRLFARNERLVCRFDTRFGPVALVMVGAMLVGSIETVWSGRHTPPRAARMVCADHQGPAFERGEEIGRFNMGSSVILLVPPGGGVWHQAVQPGHAVRMGSALSA